MRRHSVRVISAIVTVLALITPVQSHALSQFKEAPSMVWGNTYSGKTTGTTQSRPPKVAYVEQKSKFQVTFKNFPDWAKKDFQAAVDIWGRISHQQFQFLSKQRGVDPLHSEYLEAHVLEIISLASMAHLTKAFGIHRR
jgi:hypothetical protein